MKRLLLFTRFVALSLVHLPLASSPSARGREQQENSFDQGLGSCQRRLVPHRGVCRSPTASLGYAQVIPGQALDANGAPQYRVDPFWPKPLPNRWSMQQIVGISVDSKDHVWYLNRGTGCASHRADRRRRSVAGAVLRAWARADRDRSAGQRCELLGRTRLHPAMAQVAADGDCR